MRQFIFNAFSDQIDPLSGKRFFETGLVDLHRTKIIDFRD